LISEERYQDGIIIKGIGGFYYVLCGEKVVECRARGAFRKKDISPIVGDRVKIKINDDESGSVSEIYERKNFLIRPGVSNVDAIIIVSAAKAPLPDFSLVDKLLVTAEKKGIEGIICLNKTDLADDAQAESFCEVYQKAGYKVIKACALTGEGTDEIKNLIKGRTVAFTGLSGVGKSSLLKQITGKSLETGSVSKIERGRHTTRYVEIISAAGGFVFDTPGFSRLEADDVYADELWQYFPEIRERQGECRFRTCNHIREPGCSVLDAVENGEMAPSRHKSYEELYLRLKDIKDWQRK